MKWLKRLTMAMYNKNDKIIYVDPKAEILTLPVGSVYKRNFPKSGKIPYFTKTGKLNNSDNRCIIDRRVVCAKN